MTHITEIRDQYQLNEVVQASCPGAFMFIGVVAGTKPCIQVRLLFILCFKKSLMVGRAQSVFSVII
jgi:hypothetical protein